MSQVENPRSAQPQKRTPRAKVKVEETPLSTLAPVETTPAAPVTTPLAAAVQKVAEAMILGVPMVITRGKVAMRANPPTVTIMGQATWIGATVETHNRVGISMGTSQLWLALQQNTPVPSGAHYQNFGSDHTDRAAGGSRLQKPLAITIDEQSPTLGHEHRPFIQAVEDALVGRDLYLVSLDRVRLSARSNSGWPLSEPIILEAYDPAGNLVWANPRLSFERVCADCAGSFAVTGAPANTVSTARLNQKLATVTMGAPAPVPAPVPVAATPVPAPAAVLPPWFIALKAKAADYGIPNPAIFITNERKSALLMAGLANSEAEAHAMAEAEVKVLLAPAPAKPAKAAPAPAPVKPAKAAPAPVPAPTPAPVAELGAAEDVAAAIGIKIESAASRTSSSRRKEAPAAKLSDPEAIGAVVTYEQMLDKDYRTQILTRIMDFLGQCEGKRANSTEIRTHLGLPLGSAGDLEAVGTAVKRMMHRLLEEGLVVKEGTTRSTFYRRLN